MGLLVREGDARKCDVADRLGVCTPNSITLLEEMLDLASFAGENNLLAGDCRREAFKGGIEGLIVEFWNIETSMFPRFGELLSGLRQDERHVPTFRRILHRIFEGTRRWAPRWAKHDR